MNLEMSFCMLKSHNKENINVNNLFFQTISDMGWSLSKEYQCGWTKGPSTFHEYVKNGRLNSTTLLVEVYTYHSGYDEYHLTMSPDFYHSDNLAPSYYIPKDLYDLIIKELNANDFFVEVWG